MNCAGHLVRILLKVAELKVTILKKTIKFVLLEICCRTLKADETRMHSSRMHTDATVAATRCH